MSACLKDTARNAVWTCVFADIHTPERSGNIRYRHGEWTSLSTLGRGSALCVGGAADFEESVEGVELIR